MNCTLKQGQLSDAKDLAAALSDDKQRREQRRGAGSGAVQPEPYPVRRLDEQEIRDACRLMWEVFLQFEAPEYPQEGIDSFKASLEDQKRLRSMTFYGAFDGDRLVGTLCMRQPQHIGGFFVDAAWQRRGIGRRLFEAMRRDYARQEFTVHASPYAVEVYRHLGFTPTGGEQTVNGLRFTPMRYSLEAGENG